RIWRRYFLRDAFRYESFYASPSTDGRFVFALARSGRLVALRARDGAVMWTRRLGTLEYSTPAVSQGRLFVGGFDGRLHAFRTTTGNTLWTRYVGGRILAPAFVAGNLVFFSTLEGRTYGARVVDGRVVWSIRAGKYSPGIATDRHYFFSLNGLMAAFWGTNTEPKKPKPVHHPKPKRKKHTK
ncbi:MAG: hypothetical protein QOE91_1571, partial [Gaiellaceae bacterium]|nr:hypothetical protein [Gaiellaceae bacterium]